MNKIKLKMLFLVSLSFIIFSAIFLIVNPIFYDTSFMLTGLEKFFIPENSPKKDKVIVINIDERIKSVTLANLIYFITENSPQRVVLDVNFSNLLDFDKINEVRDFSKLNDKFLGFLKIADKKGLLYSDRNYSKNEKLSKNFLFLKTVENFSYANYLKDVDLENYYEIPSSKIGVVFDKKGISDNIDLLFKFEYKYLLTLNFLSFLHDKKIVIKDIDFLLTKAIYDKGKIYYDQKGRSTYLHTIRYDESVNILNFSNWINSFNTREELIKTLIDLGIYKSSDEQSSEDIYNRYLNEEKMILDIYKVKDFNNPDKNSKLSLAKTKASDWRSFKQASTTLLTDATVIVTQNNDYNWVSNFIYTKTIMDNGKNIYRIPILFVSIISILLFLFIIIYSIFVNRGITFVFPTVLSIILLPIIFYLFRLILNIDIPFFSLLLTLITALICGLVLRSLSNYIWISEVKSVYKGGLSEKHARLIANKLKRNFFGFDTNQYVVTFARVDTSVFNKKEINESNIDFIDERILEIKKIIKNNYGIINSYNQNEINFYYGNPNLTDEHWQKAIDSCKLLEELPIIIDEKREKITLALYSKKEWFKYSNQNGDKSYSSFGKSNYILSQMVNYAKKMGVNTVISDTLYKLSGLTLTVRMLDRITIANLETPIRIFELITEEQKDKNKNMVDYFHAGLKLYESQNFNEATMYFKQCLKINSNDTPSKIYLERCKNLIQNPPDEKWDASFYLN